MTNLWPFIGPIKNFTLKAKKNIPIFYYYLFPKNVEADYDYFPY